MSELGLIDVAVTPQDFKRAPPTLCETESSGSKDNRNYKIKKQRVDKWLQFK